MTDFVNKTAPGKGEKRMVYFNGFNGLMGDLPK
jgi:hypothetical protein